MIAAPGLYALGALATWAGWAFVLRAATFGFRLLAGGEPSAAPLRRGATISLVAAALLLLAGGYVTGGPALKIPLAWAIMPFTAWGTAASAVFCLVRLSQAGGALNPDERSARLKAAAIWAVVGGVLFYGFRSDREASIRIVPGAAALTATSALALVLLAVAAVAIMVFTARAAKARALTKSFATHLALVAGSIVFSLPLAWLVITSFKEDVDMASPNGIVWVPRVQETVPYFSKDKPLYATRVLGDEVQGTIMEKAPGGKVKLDINKPMSMRGMTVEAAMSDLTQIPTQAPLVKVKMDGQDATGKVIEDLEDGSKRVEAISPPSLAGRQQVFPPADVTPIRKIGLRTQNYSDALDFLPPEAHKGLTYLKNTMIIVVLGMIGTILSSAIVAYAFSRMRFPGRDAMFWLMLSTMMLPGAVTKLPQFMIFKQFGWIDTLYPLWVPAFFASAFNVFMLRQFFRQIPMELEDAAKIDGAGYLRTFWSVMMPQVKPALAVIAIFTFVGAWNNFFDPLIYINSPENMTISYAVQLYASDRSGEPGLVTAFTTLAMLPVLALFFFAQKYFIEGVTLTGLGGR